MYPFKGLVRQARGPRGEGSVDAWPTKAKFSTNALNNKSICSQHNRILVDP